MASDLSTYLGNKIVRWLGGNDMPTAPSALYAALFNGDPKAGGTEVTNDIAGSAGRPTIALTAPSSGTDNEMSNDSDVDFGNSEGAVTVTHVAIYDAATSGNLLATKSLGSNSVEAGQEVKFAAGDLTFTIGS